MVPPISAWPSNRIEMKALRSSASAMARRISGLSNGGAAELTMMLVETLIGATAEAAVGAWVLTALGSGAVTWGGDVMSNLPAMTPGSAVERFGMMGKSMPARCGRPFFQ